MNKRLQNSPVWLLRPALVGLLLLSLAACAAATHKANKQKDAAAYNTQLGVAYMNQGDLARAKEKLDRAVSEDPDNADVRSARAMLKRLPG